MADAKTSLPQPDGNLPPAISVLIINWNGGQFLLRCLKSLAAQTYSSFEVILIDNNSTDDSAFDLERQWPTFDLRVERLPRNIGFAAANNLGARLARGRWLALLNPDAFPTPDWLECLACVAERYREFACFASQLIQAENEALLDGAGDVYNISGIAWRRHHNLPLLQGANQVEEVFSPCAAAALYARDAFFSVGGFDENYFSYHEDVDLGFRLRLQGLRCLYVPQAVVYHIGSASQGKRSDFAIYHGQRNLVWCYVKNMPGYLFWTCLPAHLLANLFFLFYYASRGRGRVIARAKLDACRGLGAALRKRREIQRTRRVALAEIARVMDREWLSPYLGSRWRRLARRKTA